MYRCKNIYMQHSEFVLLFICVGFQGWPLCLGTVLCVCICLCVYAHVHVCVRGLMCMWWLTCLSQRKILWRMVHLASLWYLRVNEVARLACRCLSPQSHHPSPWSFNVSDYCHKNVKCPHMLISEQLILSWWHYFGWLWSLLGLGFIWQN